MLEMCRTPELAVEVTLQPVRRLGVDAAILFSDIVVPLQGMGVELEIKPGVGPVIDHPIRTMEDVATVAPTAAGRGRAFRPRDDPRVWWKSWTFRSSGSAAHRSRSPVT